MLVENEQDEEFDIPEESKISKTLSDKTIKTVVMLVLFLLFMLAICSADTYVESNIMHVQGLKNLRLMYERVEREPELYPEYKVAFDHYLNRTTHTSISYKLVFLRVPDPNASKYSNDLEYIEYERDPKLITLRKDEY